jgi:hypothetical protein
MSCNCYEITRKRILYLSPRCIGKKCVAVKIKKTAKKCEAVNDRKPIITFDCSFTESIKKELSRYKENSNTKDTRISFPKELGVY